MGKKSWIVIVSLVFAFGLGSTASATPAGTMAYYPLDGNGDDASSNGHDGTIVGSVTPDSDRFGNPHAAMRFSGAGYINIGTGLKVPFPITVAAWIKLDTDGVHEIFKNDRQTGDDWYHGVGVAVANGAVHAFVGSGYASPWTRKTKSTNEGVVPIGEWCHVSVVFNAYDDIQLYVDGVERAGTYGGSGTGMTYSSSFPGDIGRGEPSGSGDQVYGRVDELYFCNRALSTVEIRDLYLPHHSSDLLAHYPLDGNGDDASSNGHDGTIVGTVTPDSDRFGNPSGAMRFNGTGYINIGTGLKVPFPITVAAWVNLDTDGVHEIFKNDRQTGDDWYHGVGVAVANGAVHAFVGSGYASPWTRKTKTTNDAVVTTGEWCHVSVVFNAYDDIQLYVDGAERVGTYGGSGTGMTYSSNFPGDIGRGEPSGSGDQVFGQIDDVRFYGRALTAGEVLSLYQPDIIQSVYAYYPLNGNGDDASGNSHDGIIVGTVAPDSDRFGNPSGAMRFNGTGYINIGTGLKVPFPITVAAWVNLDTDGVHEIFKNDRQTGDDWYHGVGVAVANGAVHAFVGSGYASPWTRKTKSTNEGVVPIGEWCHVSVVFNAYDDIQLYVDGVERAGTYGGSGTGMTYSSSFPGDIGRGEPSGSGDQVIGRIDDLVFCDNALTREQLNALVNPFGYTAAVGTEDNPGYILVSNAVGYPNPFNPTVTISYEMASDAHVNVEVYDIRGRRVAALLSGTARAGINVINWDGADDQGRKLGSGVYLCLVRAAGAQKVVKLELVK